MRNKIKEKGLAMNDDEEPTEDEEKVKLKQKIKELEIIRKVELGDKDKQISQAKNLIHLLMKDLDDPVHESPDKFINENQSNESEKESKIIYKFLVDEIDEDLEIDEEL